MEPVKVLERRYVFRIAGSLVFRARLLTQAATTELSLFLDALRRSDRAEACLRAAPYTCE
jgi:hypothetical protein